MTDTPQLPDDYKLASLRRLFHHIQHGGQVNQRDHDLAGGLASADNVAKAIHDLEEAQTTSYRL